MVIRLNQVKMLLSHDEVALENQILKQLKISKQELLRWEIKKESLDARKDPPYVVYTVDCQVKNQEVLMKRNKTLTPAPDETYKMPFTGAHAQKLKNRPVVVGFGPAGMYAAWLLAKMGYEPLVIERGDSVDQRSQAIEKYWREGILDTESNVQFGEGGAGTFSDGKLTTRIKDLRAKFVLERLVECGAPKEILYQNKPHVGTDLLKPTVKAFRETIIENGGEIRFNTKVETLKFDENCHLIGIQLNTGEEIPCEVAVLAIGHSSRDTLEQLKENNVQMTPKPFAIGVRIEHPQAMIDQSQYKVSQSELRERYGAAEYHLTAEAENGRSVYTFCMCPGGYVVGAASERDTIVTNGMSEHARDQRNANSALLVNIMPSDFESEDVLAGVALQRKIEKAAFELGGKNHFAPIMSVGAFLNEKPLTFIGEVEPSYQPGYTIADLRTAMPAFMVEALTDGLRKLDGKLKGFSMADAIMTGFETRTSSPVRIVRDSESLESSSHKGLYPCGEGAGYAGGIMSSACDGLKVAEQIICTYHRG